MRRDEKVAKGRVLRFIGKKQEGHLAPESNAIVYLEEIAFRIEWY